MLIKKILVLLHVSSIKHQFAGTDNQDDMTYTISKRCNSGKMTNLPRTCDLGVTCILVFHKGRKDLTGFLKAMQYLFLNCSQTFVFFSKHARM